LAEIYWQKNTEQGNHYLELPAWGKKVSLIGAKAKGILRLRDLEIENPMVYFDSHLPVSGIKRFLMRIGMSIFKVNEIMGNEPFYNEYTVILDLQQNRLGFLKSLNYVP
jgi:hypothetical protein